MEVQLYVYDLSKGLARQLSRQFLGIQIDAVYHTSIVVGGIEYFYGAGVQSCYPGTTHHGAPEEVIKLGSTSLPMDVILEYLESLKQVYTPEAYDLFAHNCNNFSNDFAMFLVGKGIPDHITSLPQQVLNTPFGQMLRPQIDAAMRSVTQAPVPPQNVPNGAPGAVANGSANGVTNSTNGTTNGSSTSGKVHSVTSLQEVDRLLTSAKDSSAVIFFTSSTCAPCKIMYPVFDELAEEAGSKGVFIKVDINQAYDVAAKYSVRATPTFITFLKGMKDDQWSGANEPQLRGNVRLLVQQASMGHPHTRLDLPKLLGASLHPVTYEKIPPLEKLIPKVGEHGRHPIIAMVAAFITTRRDSGSREAPLPSLPDFASFLRDAISKISPDNLFAAYDLFRLTLTDPRVSGFFAEEDDAATLAALISHVNNLQECPYNLRLVTLQLACNLFSTSLVRTHLLAHESFSALLTHLLSASLLDDKHGNVRIAAASLAFNIAAANHRMRIEAERDVLDESEQVEIVAALLEAVAAEQENKEAVLALLTSLGLLVYCADMEGEVVDVCKAMDAKGTVLAKMELCGKDDIVVEVGKVLLGKGLEM
ncbi:Desumoylating isopeptidase 1 [Lasiodiplodia theobromae]|uniref:Desumoylating isopeptidase 1 n=1 Tax=Lasiodiplodia theobromae TaxID=45133 RepID=A0A5N5DSQ4_9PEZI|nr:Desumoylating isopeptidase 1 [Lasiodiplodia theobromae]